MALYLNYTRAQSQTDSNNFNYVRKNISQNEKQYVKFPEEYGHDKSYSHRNSHINSENKNHSNKMDKESLNSKHTCENNYDNLLPLSLSKYSFDKMVCKDKVENINNQQNYSYRSNNSTASSYLNKRHFDTIEKVSRMRCEKILNEAKQLRDRPMISDYSKFISRRKNSCLISQVDNQEKSVFERLTDPAQFRKKHETVEKIIKIKYQDNCPHKPEINEVSKYFKRDFEDLLLWNKLKKEKFSKKIRDKSHEEPRIPKIDEASRDLLIENNPSYLQMKVEDRLIEKGIR
jgi:hypothetical protein